MPLVKRTICGAPRSAAACGTKNAVGWSHVSWAQPMEHTNRTTAAPRIPPSVLRIGQIWYQGRDGRYTQPRVAKRMFRSCNKVLRGDDASVTLVHACPRGSCPIALWCPDDDAASGHTITTPPSVPRDSRPVQPLRGV